MARRVDAVVPKSRSWLGIEHSHAPLLLPPFHPLLLPLPLKHLVRSAWLRQSKENRNAKSHPSSRRRTRRRPRRSAPGSPKHRRRVNPRADKNPRTDRVAVVTVTMTAVTTTTTTVMVVVIMAVAVPLAQGHPVSVCCVLLLCRPQIWRA